KKMDYNFENEPLPDFSKPEERDKMEAAIKAVKRTSQQTIPAVVGEDSSIYGHNFNSINPNDPKGSSWRIAKATENDVEKAIPTAQKTFGDWKARPLEDRTAILMKAAKIFQEKKYELSAYMVLECGKNWNEAAADTAELIDFCNFYAKDAQRLNRAKPKHSKTEEIDFKYEPLGVGSIIAPWNFPAAIFGGMITAAIVMGNTVLAKPSSDAAATGYQVFKTLKEAGVPPGVINFLPGSGKDVGKMMVEDKNINFIAFTGSREVGEQIITSAAYNKGTNRIKFLPLLEMGGKNGIIVCEDADLELAASEIVKSAFGYQGQKCSACSRAIIEEKVYKEVLEMIVEKTKKLTIGPVEHYENYMGSVINEEAMKKILAYIEIGIKEGKVMHGGHRIPSLDGYVVAPTIIANVSPYAVVAQEEIFGPVLSIIKAESYDKAIRIMNETPYGLTGSVFTRSKENIEKGIKKIDIGNLYFNRKCTGALVYYHPFGGRKMSGINKKAGGFDTLSNFAAPKSIAITKNTYK
ncbi:aldehyde dehydrogenase family protein, partial [Candidatus Woesearchaeota archaeon]|nr:aldehyde dehydrogenase family protein [Candidatus Woesearchaeota archaeon]